jgi:hypothetical protein
LSFEKKLGESKSPIAILMQAVRNPLAMPAPLRFGNWPSEEHLVNKWRGFMALSSLEHLVAYEERLVIALSSDEGEDE